jgi:hypothetical protein
MSSVILRVLAEIISGSPKQERKLTELTLAELTLEGNLVPTIAEHMMKVLLFNQHHKQETEKWKKDLIRQFGLLNRKVAKKSRRLTSDPEDRRLVFTELHVGAKRIMRLLDELTADAYQTILSDDNYKNLKVSEPANIEDGVFSTLGFTLKDVRGALGKGFELTFNNKKILNTTEN